MTEGEPSDEKAPLMQEAQPNSTETGVAITWKNLSVKTVAGRELLKHVDGIAVPGMMTALMGASGAGKTTLLNTLLARNLRGLVTNGEILVNGQNVGRGVTDVSAYVQQEDLFVGTLTVGEHLHLQANMRLPHHWSVEDRKRRVEEVARQMLLENSMNSRIGVPGMIKGISGGELKRLAFATEIIVDPAVLFADEPTTGLDSHMALLVVKRMESLSGDQGKTIVCTIHQPSSEVFEMFDRVLFLCNGRVAFFGSPPEAIIFFAKCGYRIPDHTNPADHYIHTLAMFPGKEAQCRKKGNKICDEFSDSDLCKAMMLEIREFSKARQLMIDGKATWFTMVLALFCRNLKDNIRKKSMFRAKMIQKIFMGVFVGLLYLRAGRPMDQARVLDMKGVLFYYCSELTYSTVFGIQTYMPSDFPLLAREYHDGIYPVSAYFVAKVLSYAMIFSIDGTLMVVISYFLIGLYPSASSFFLTVFVALLIELCAAAAGVAICSIAPSYAVAVSITGPLLTIFSMTGGIFTNVEKIPGWIRWIQYCSWFRFGYESLIIAQFGNGGYNDIACSNGTQCIKTGEEVIRSLQFQSSNFVPNLVVMFIYTCTVYCLGYSGLVYRVIRSR